MEKTMIFCREDQIDIDTPPGGFRRGKRTKTNDFSLKTASARLEREYIQRALTATDGNRTQAAKLLEISLRGLLYKIKAYGIR
jgi:two-component system response regulator AtoC